MPTDENSRAMAEWPNGFIIQMFISRLSQKLNISFGYSSSYANMKLRDIQTRIFSTYTGIHMKKEIQRRILHQHKLFKSKMIV
jgi:hypothetical protein